LVDPNDITVVQVEEKKAKRSTATPTPTPKPKPKPKPSTVKPAPVEVAPVAVTSSAKCKGIGVLPNVVAACNQIVAAFPELGTIGGRAARANASCHPSGQALDLMVTSNALGDRISAYAKAHKAELGIALILWEVPNHFDHVHLSFAPCRF